LLKNQPIGKNPDSRKKLLNIDVAMTQKIFETLKNSSGENDFIVDKTAKNAPREPLQSICCNIYSVLNKTL